MIIRQAQQRDAPGIARVHVQSWRETYAGLVPEQVLANLSVERRQTWWQSQIELPGAGTCLFVAVADNGEIAGFASGGPNREGPPEYGGELHAIYLLRKYHGQGVGRGLTLSVARHLLAEGIGSMCVWVLKENPTIRFYRHMGARDLFEKEVTMGGTALVETCLGWDDLALLEDQSKRGSSTT